MFITRLHQICIEDACSKQHRTEIIMEDIGTTLDTYIDKALEYINEYLTGDYYPSKNARIDTLVIENKYFSSREIIESILVEVLPVKKSIQIQALVGKIAPLLHYEDKWEGIRTAAEIIAVVAKSDLYDIHAAGSTESGSMEITSNFELEEHTIEKLAKLKYLPPLVCKPDTITKNLQSTYLTKIDSVILGKHNHHNKPLALDALNIANSVELSLDERVLAQPETANKILNKIEKLEKQYSDKKHPTILQELIEEREKLEQFNEFAKASVEVYNEMLDADNKFFFGWKYDKRGRMYSLGYHVNIQSTEYKKALINLANPQVIKLN